MTRRASPGFSLLELSVVLAIISLIFTFSMNIGTNAINGSNRLMTQERLAAVKLALDTYADIHGYLPCPASRAKLTSDASFGFEQRDTTDPTTCNVGIGAGNTTGLKRDPETGTQYVVTGAVPVRTLGLPDNFAGDAWANKLTYAVSSDHVSNPNNMRANTGLIAVFAGDRTGTNYIITTNQYSAASKSATYVVVSHGADGKGAWGMDSIVVGTACGTSANNDVENCDDDGEFYDTEFNNGAQASTFFDDYIVWGSNNSVRAPLISTNTGCTSSCENWCVPCSNTYPTTGATYSTWLTGWEVCTRVITSIAPCKAYCTYANPQHNIYCP